MQHTSPLKWAYVLFLGSMKTISAFQHWLSGNILNFGNHEQVTIRIPKAIRRLGKPRRRRQGEHLQTKELKSWTMIVQLRYNFSWISLPSSAQQQRELMTKFCEVWGTRTRAVSDLIVSFFRDALFVIESWFENDFFFFRHPWWRFLARLFKYKCYLIDSLYFSSQQI